MLSRSFHRAALATFIVAAAIFGSPPANLAATIFNVLFDPAELRLQTNMPREILQMVENGKPIRELF